MADSLRAENWYSGIGKLALQATFGYDLGDSANRYRFEQDASGRDTAITNYQYVSGRWKPISKSSYRFDLHGNQTLSAQYNYDSLAGRFLLARAFANQYRYDAQQRLTERVDLQTDQNGLMQRSIRVLFAYSGTAPGYVSSEFQRPEANNQWSPWYKYADLEWYDFEKRLPLRYNRYDYNGSAFDLGEAYILTYTDSNNYTRFAQLVTASVPRADYRETYSLTDSTRLYIREDSGQNGWVFNTRQTEVRDHHGQTIRIRYESFLTGVWRTTGGTEWALRYSPQDDVEQEVISWWQADSSRFEPDVMYRYDNYFDFVLAAKAPGPIVGASVYPVPARDWIMVDGVAGIQSASALDALGKPTPLPCSDKKIDASALKPGVYLLQIAGRDRVLRQAHFVKD